MEKFKLRIWDRDLKIMTYSDEWVHTRWSDIQTHQENGLLMVCSGLKAVDGRLIYEGDIVKVYNTYKELTFVGRMIFKHGHFMLESNQLTTHSRWINYDMMILGNQYENPSLLAEA